MAQRKRILLVSMRRQVRSLASLHGLRIWCCHELWRRLQMWLGSGVAVAVALASGYSSLQLPLGLGTSICCKCGSKKKKKEIKRTTGCEYVVGGDQTSFFCHPAVLNCRDPAPPWRLSGVLSDPAIRAGCHQVAVVSQSWFFDF